ncbi:MAG: heavy-metal-associated domain-containing protein [Bryobacterales bacterium]|nr:heavy-metal-associated domain-containing protein [Bryobacterales bacterium]
MAAITLKIDNMHCQACVNHVKRALEHVAGLRIKYVQIGSASVETHDADAAIAAVTRAGYPAARA